MLAPASVSELLAYQMADRLQAHSRLGEDSRPPMLQMTGKLTLRRAWMKVSPCTLTTQVHAAPGAVVISLYQSSLLLLNRHCLPV